MASFLLSLSLRPYAGTGSATFTFGGAPQRGQIPRCGLAVVGALAKRASLISGRRAVEVLHPLPEAGASLSDGLSFNTAFRTGYAVRPSRSRPRARTTLPGSRICYALWTVKATKRWAISIAKARKCNPAGVSDNRS